MKYVEYVGMTCESNESNEVYSADSAWIVVSSRHHQEESHLGLRLVEPDRKSHGSTITSHVYVSRASLCLLNILEPSLKDLGTWS
jgi:hypothetical protein